MIIAIDFDGTIVKDAFPEVGELQPHAKEVMSELREAGHKLILWTCREDHFFDKDSKYLTYAIDFLEENGIIFDAVNETIYNKDWKHFHNRKPFAHVYIDDRNLGGFPGWLRVREEILAATPES